MTSTAATPEEYIAGLPADRQEAISLLRKVIGESVQPGFVEGMQYGHIGWYVPHETYPNGYHCDPKQPVPYIGLASQKQHMAVYMFGVYIGTESGELFRQEYEATGKKLDMGASCVRFKKIENLPVELIGKWAGKWSVAEFLARYEDAIPPSKKKAKKTG